MVNIGEHIDLLVGLDNPVDDLRSLHEAAGVPQK
jgi:hypothetical protein